MGTSRLIRRRSRPPIASLAALAVLFTGAGCRSESSPTPTSSTTSTSTTTTVLFVPGESVDGRPLRRRRWRRRGPLLPSDRSRRLESRQEYASVASFSELSLRLMAVGAPPALVSDCHRAALDEIRHAEIVCGRATASSGFGPIPGLWARRVGGLPATRRRRLCRIAVESYLDGWRNESAAAQRLRQRAEREPDAARRSALTAIAADEDGHADLARRIVTWCFEEDPAGVGRALAAFAPDSAVADNGRGLAGSHM